MVAEEVKWPNILSARPKAKNSQALTLSLTLTDSLCDLYLTDAIFP